MHARQRTCVVGQNELQVDGDQLCSGKGTFGGRTAAKGPRRSGFPPLQIKFDTETMHTSTYNVNLKVCVHLHTCVRVCVGVCVPVRALYY